MNSRHLSVTCLLLLVSAAVPNSVQSQVPTQSIPRTADGKPDLHGIWQVLNAAAWNVEDHVARPGVPAGFGVVESGENNEIPYQPAALKKRDENYQQRAYADPDAKCYLSGVPRITYMPFPFQIFQQPDRVAILYEYNHTSRSIPLDGSAHVEGLESWMGDSRGRWEGDTLVVDVRNFNDQTWFDKAGNFHSNKLHVVERYTLDGPDRINYEVTIEDPEVFTGPWKMRMPLYRRAEQDARLLEYECVVFYYEEARTTR